MANAVLLRLLPSGSRIVEVEARLAVGVDDVLLLGRDGGAADLIRGRRGQRLHVGQQRPIEQQRILQAQLDAELSVSLSRTSAISTWISTIGGRSSSSLMTLDDFAVEPRRGADDQAVGGQLRAR